MLKFNQFFYEKYVLGLIENVYLFDLEGVGKIASKLDSGNGAFNVLHGENIEISPDKKYVRFVTVNNFSLEKPVIQTISINVGAGNTEDRPVVEFDVEIGGKRFSKVPFSIGNRSTNDHKILIGKKFIENNLNALIDVSLINVADKNIEVKY